MRVLLDECVPRCLRQELQIHEVRTVVEMGWSGIKNSALIQKAAVDFDVLLTVDQNLQYQKNLSSLPISVIRRGHSGTFICKYKQKIMPIYIARIGLKFEPCCLRLKIHAYGRPANPG